MSANHTPIRVALLEPELITRLALSRCLRFEGVDVFYIKQLSEAFDRNPDAIVASLSAAANELEEAAGKYRSKNKRPAIVITSWGMQNETDPALFPDFIFLRKPIICSDIVWVIRSALGRTGKK